MRKPEKIHSRARVRKNLQAKRKGTKNARTPSKVLWIRRVRVLRRLLRKYREQKKIDKHIYHTFYQKAKGNQYKNKRVLIEFIHKAKTERAKVKQVEEQNEARKAKAKAKVERKAAKKTEVEKETKTKK